MPVCCSIIFSLCRRSVTRTYHPRAPRRNIISKWLNDRAARNTPQQGQPPGCNRAFSERIPEPAFVRLPWAQQPAAPFAIAAPRTFVPGSTVYPRACYPLGGQQTVVARNFLQDRRAQDSVAPATGNTRQILLTTYSWPRIRTWPLDHGSTVRRPDGQTWDARNSRTRELLGWSASGQAACG
jgi:hypothetical protein